MEQFLVKQNNLTLLVLERLEKNGIPVGNDHTLTGCRIHCEPAGVGVEQCIREDILEKE